MSCKGITTKGIKCTKKVMPESEYCKIHSAETDKRNTRTQCEGKYKSGENCNNYARHEEKFCGCHSANSNADRPQCIGKMHNGNACKSFAKPNSEYCGRHSKETDFIYEERRRKAEEFEKNKEERKKKEDEKKEKEKTRQKKRDQSNFDFNEFFRNFFGTGGARTFTSYTKPMYNDKMTESIRFMGLTKETLNKNTLRTNYLKLSKEYHPDKGGSTEKYTMLRKHYDYLCSCV